MPLIIEHTDSLPYIDPPPSPSSLAHATTLITTDLSSHPHQDLHPLIPAPPTLHFTPALQLELTRIARSEPLTAIDLTRYSGTSPTTSPNGPTASDLKQAYTNAHYLTQRLQALSLLEEFGKNAWLVGNEQLEGLLRGVEGELVGVRGGLERVNKERKERQEGRREGVEGGEREWRDSVGGVVRAGVAVGGVEGRIKEALREGKGRN